MVSENINIDKRDLLFWHSVLTFIVLQLVQLDTGHATQTRHRQYQGKFIDTYHV